MLDKRNVCLQVLAQFVIALIVAGVMLMELTAAQADEPTKRAALLIQREHLKDRGLKREIDRYIELVQLRFDTGLISYPVDSAISPLELRDELRNLHSKKAIQGAFLVGQFQFPTFHNECGDESTMFAYYSDLDGQIEDRNGDGKFDFYDPWLGGETDEKPVHELWIAVLRPYFHHQRDFRSLRDIQTYFHKVNEHFEEFKEATDHCYNEKFLKEWLGVRGVWEKERFGFDWRRLISATRLPASAHQTPVVGWTNLRSTRNYQSSDHSFRGDS